MHTSLPPVFSHIETNQEAYIQRLIDYVRHPSISAHDIGIQEVSELLIEMLTKIGFETQSIPTAGHPMVLGRWEKKPARLQSCSMVITMSSPPIPWKPGYPHPLNPPSGMAAFTPAGWVIIKDSISHKYLAIEVPP